MRTILKQLQVYGERLFLLSIVGLLVVTPLSDTVSAEDVDGSWFAPGNLSMAYEEVPYTPPPLNNMDCDYQDYAMLILEAKRVWPPDAIFPYDQKETWHTAKCAVQTPRGMQDGEYLETIPGELAGKFAGHSGKVLLIPNSNQLVTASWHIDNIAMAMDFYGHLVPEFNQYTGAITYKLVNRSRLRDENGQVVYLRPDAYGFSRNGKWMITDSTKGFIRINVATREILSFAPGITYGIGIGGNTTVAITEDGRYAIRGYSDQYGWSLRLYDLESCEPPSKDGEPANCRYKDLGASLQQSFDYFIPHTVKFVTPDLLTLRAAKRAADGTLRYYYVRLAPAGKTIEDITYLALGDSFSSGEGAYDYEPDTDTPKNKCHLSRNSYPYLAAQTLELDDFHSVACSGAKYDPHYNATPQYEDVNAPEWLAGSKMQRTFVSQARPDALTISMIGNDIGFKNKIIRCLAPDSCFHFREDRQSIVEEINSKFYSLVALYSNIKMNAKEDAKVYVLGYPQLFSVTGDCRFSVNFDLEERRMARSLIGYLNAVIKAAAERAGVVYIDVENAFSGHLLCGDGEEAVNGLAAGDDIGIFGANFVGNESFHPNRLGHQLLADELLEQSAYFTKPMPEPNPTKTVPGKSSQEYVTFVESAPSGGTVKRILFVGTDTVRGVVRGGRIEVGIDPMLPANTLFDIWFYSNPTHAGTLMTDENGALQGEVTVPNDLDPGFHTLYLRGKDLVGKDVDLYEVVYVAASAEDYDGDGIPNQDELCLTTEPINVDYDRDGIDDACDLEISEPPVDDVPPEVVGALDREPDADGWYKDDVTITWTAADPEPSSGAPTQPALTIANKEGIHTYTSEESCDPLGNCATGSLEIKIDKTAPLLGSATWSCAATCPADSTVITIPVSDELSGVAAAEYFLGDNDPGLGSATPLPVENGVIKLRMKDLPLGTHQITIRAKDKAGNWSLPLHEYAKVYNLLNIKLVSRQQPPVQSPIQTVIQTIVTIVQTVVETIVDKLSKLFKW